MMYLTAYLYACFCVFASRSVSSTPSSPDDLYVLYSSSDYNIIVKDLTSGDTVKTFTVRVENPTFIVMDYENDALFFTSNSTLYQIYLVDENGDRKISGKGELFTNPLADHIETSFYKLSTYRKVKGFIFDKSEGTLYLLCPYYKNMGDFYMKLDSQNGKLLSTGRIQFTASSYVLYNRMLYATVDSRGCTHLTKITLDDLNRELGWSWIEKRKCWRPDTLFTVDAMSNRMFFIEDKDTIRLLDGDLTRTPIGSMEDRYVISDSEVTKDINGISVYGNVVVWSSSSWEKLYVGLLHGRVSFLSKQNVRVLEKVHSGSANIVIFKNDISTAAAVRPMK